MPVIVSPGARRLRLIILCLPLVALIVAGWLIKPKALDHQGCITEEHISLCAASSMDRTTRRGVSNLEHARFDLRPENPNRLHWQVAKNESIAFQLHIRRLNWRATKKVVVNTSGGTAQSSVFQAHYLKVDNAGYQWGPPSTTVLPYPAHYPDALIPSDTGCGNESVSLFNAITLPQPGANQSVWIELYVPDTTRTGPQTLIVEIELQNTVVRLPITLDVIDARIPHSTSIDAIAELYRTYKLEGVGVDRNSSTWQKMAQCYQQLAHRHRMVFIERTPVAPSNEEDWEAYRAAFGAALTGELFTSRFGYTGSGYDTPVSVWRTPWPQEYDVTVTAALNDEDVDHWTTLAQRWQSEVVTNNWSSPRFFAYVFDEVDGPSDKSESHPDRRRYIARVHSDMKKIQSAIDKGAQEIDLLWTSHSDPSIWQDDKLTSLEGVVRLWAPNGHAANTDYLAKRIAKGERAWFYHSGHPAVGGHSINLPGSDLRSWGVIGARYGIQGQLMWAANLGSDQWPFAQPSYKPDDDRVGNGVIVYPGNQLPKIGFEAVPGPIPSMRMKTWRRGLQDAELYFLAHKRFPDEAQRLIKALIPRALREAVEAGDKQPTWPSEAAVWIQWREDLLTMLRRP